MVEVNQILEATKKQRKYTPNARSLANLRPAKKGECRNPGGRPKTKLISEAYKRILEEQGAEALAAQVHKDALSSKARASDRLAAVKEMTDRTEGKATQAIRITGEVDAATMARLAELADLLRS